MRATFPGLVLALTPVAAGALPVAPPPPLAPLVRPVVMGGAEPPASVVRSTVWIYISSLKKGVEPQSCTGVILTELHIVTAAHCFEDIEIVRPEQQVKIFYYRDASHMEVWSPATKVTVHPNYARLPQEKKWTNKTEVNAADYDLAVVTLKIGIPKGYAVMHAALGPLAPREDDVVAVAGFGLTRLTPEPPAKNKKEKTAELPPMRMAKLEYDTFNATRARFRNIDAGVPLKGDSGGPSFVFDKKGDPRLWGLVTRIFTYDINGERLVEGGEMLRLEPHWPWLAQVVKPELVAFAQAHGVKPPPVAFAGYVPRGEQSSITVAQQNAPTPPASAREGEPLLAPNSAARREPPGKPLRPLGGLAVWVGLGALLVGWLLRTAWRAFRPAAGSARGLGAAMRAALRLNSPAS